MQDRPRSTNTVARTFRYPQSRYQRKFRTLPKLVPTKPIDGPIAKNLMATVEEFMRSLAVVSEICVEA
jgi:hypothetical protein